MAVHPEAAQNERGGRLRAPEVLRRADLEKRLDEAFGKRLTVVVASAGFGKTTLVEEWTRDLASVWYTLGPRDRELTSFGTGLFAALREEVDVLPAVSVGTLKTAAAQSDELLRADALAGLICQALDESLGHDLVLVLDDVHELEAAPGSTRLLAGLSRQAPELVHVVLLSRAEPPFPIARLRGRGEVLELSAADLCFGEHETDALVASTLGTEETKLTEELQAATGGWPAAVRLALDTLGHAPAEERTGVLNRLSRADGPLLPYLAEEVFGREPPAVRELIGTVAHLDRFNADLCGALGLERPGDLLDRLARRGLLVRGPSEADGWYELHALVREFAQAEWPLSVGEQRRLQSRAATWYERNGAPREALASVMATGDRPALAALLTRRGEGLLPLNAQLVLAAARLLADHELDAPLERIFGEAHYAAGDIEAARRCFERAAEGSPLLAPRLARFLGLTHYPHGDLEEALRCFARARLGDEDTAEAALLLALWSNAQALHGDLAGAEATASRALAAARAADEGRAVAHALHALGLAAQLAGDRRSAREHYSRALAQAERVGEVLQVARARNNLAADHLSCGECADALAQLEIALPLAERHALDDLVPLIVLNRSDARRQLGLLDDALADLEAADRLFGGRSNTSGWLCAVADVYRERGDIALAQAAYESAVTVCTDTGNLERLRPALSGLALTLVDEDPERARGLAERSVAAGEGVFDGEALQASAWVALALGEREESAAVAVRAAAAARSLEGRAVLAESLELRALCAPSRTDATAYLEEAISIWQRLENTFRAARSQLALARLSGDGQAAARAERRLRAAGVRLEAASRAAGLLRSLPPLPSPPLALRCLGGFQVLRDGKPVTRSEWQSKKARDLLKLLVCRRGRPTPREVIMETLWPGEDPARLSNRLSVALSTLRSVLDPEHSFAADHYLRADQRSVALQQVAVDVEEFMTDAAAGLGGDAERLEAAEARYAGDFLEEDTYEDWAVGLREEARAAYTQVARALAERRLAEGDAEAAARYLRRLLERDPYDERGHLALVSALSAGGQHGEARRAYRVYTSRMEAIEVEAAPFPARASPRR
jgi:ATP/maltotriose-dependent transcriptional regulator MalT